MIEENNTTYVNRFAQDLLGFKYGMNQKLHALKDKQVKHIQNQSDSEYWIKAYTHDYESFIKYVSEWEQKGHECISCKISFLELNEFIEHLTINHSQKSKCFSCMATYENQMEFCKHILDKEIKLPIPANSQNPSVPQAKVPEIPKDGFKCDYCEHYDTQTMDYQIHLLRQHQMPSFFKCRQEGCSYEQKNLVIFCQHMIESHPNVKKCAFTKRKYHSYKEFIEIAVNVPEYLLIKPPKHDFMR